MTTTTTTTGEPPTTWTPERLVYGLVSADDPDITPDGSRIVYSLSTPNQETGKVTSHLWLCGVDGSNARQITQSGTRNGSARWSPDGQQIAFVSDRVEKAGIFLLPLGAGSGGGDARELTRHAQGVSDLAWSPDGSQIAYLTTYDPANPDEEKRDSDLAPQVRSTRRIDYKQDGRGYLDNVRQQVWLLDVASGERRRLTSTLADHAAPQWSPDGTQIAAAVQSHNGMCNQLALIDVASGEQTLVGPEMGNVSSWSWSPDSQRILYTGDVTQTWQDDLWLLDVASGESRRLTDDLQVLPSGAPPVWLDERQVLISGVRAGGSGLHVVDSEQGTIEPVVSWEANHGGLRTDRSNRYAVMTHTSITTTGEIYVQDLEANTGKVITSLNTQALADTPSGVWERFAIQRGAYEIESWMLKPANFDPNQRYPVILDIHGGPNGHFGYSFQPIHQLLASHGYVVVFSNPRGSSSYGREFTLQVGLDWGGEDYHDLMAVLDHVLEHPWADGTRTGVSGYSYGGYMTAWIIGQTRRFQAAVCGAPCFDLESMYGTSDISHTFGELQWGGPPSASKEWYAKHSPSEYAHTATTPTLIVHGEADERCPIGQGEQMFVALLKAGCEVEFARYPGGAHSFRRMGHPEHRRDLWERTLGWFQTHLGPGTGV